MDKILILKIGAIGDVALATSILSGIGSDNITWVVGESSKEVLQAVDYKGVVVCIDEKRLLQGSWISKFSELIKIWKKIAFKNFDIIITAHKDSRYRLISMLSYRKNHVFFTKKDFFPLGGQFHGLQYFHLLYKQSILNQERIENIFCFPKTKKLLSEKIYENTVILSPGGVYKDPGKLLRTWPLKYYVKLAELLIFYDCQILLIGDKTQRYIGADFSGKKIVNLIGKTTILDLMNIFQSALGVVTHDGGALHLARLAGCKICALFGPTSPRDFSLPGPNEIALWGGDGLNCRPCYNGKTFARCAHQSCMKQLHPEYVLEVIVKAWGLKLRENSSDS